MLAGFMPALVHDHGSVSRCVTDLAQLLLRGQRLLVRLEVQWIARDASVMANNCDVPYAGILCHQFQVHDEISDGRDS